MGRLWRLAAEVCLWIYICVAEAMHGVGRRSQAAVSSRARWTGDGRGRGWRPVTESGEEIERRNGRVRRFEKVDNRCE